jgi:hypothetical protein
VNVGVKVFLPGFEEAVMLARLRFEVGGFRARSAPSELGERGNQHSAPDGIRTHAGAGLSRLPLPFGLRGPAIQSQIEGGAGAILTVECVQREGSTVAVAEAPPSLIRVPKGSLPRSPVAIRSSITSFAFGRKCTGCTPVIRPVALSRK